MIDQLIQKHGKRLYGLCLTLCADTYEADDLYQETWLKAVKHISSYDQTKEFEPWLTAICVNTYRNALRRITKSPFLSFVNGRQTDRLLQSVPAPEAEDYSELHQAIDSLPEKLRLTIILFYFCGMDIASVASALKIPSGTVKSRLHKARNRLKEKLEHGTDL